MIHIQKLTMKETSVTNIFQHLQETGLCTLYTQNILNCTFDSDHQEEGSTLEHQHDELLPPATKKRRKQSPHIVSVTARSVFEEVGSDLNAGLNSADSTRSIYNSFKEQLVIEYKRCTCHE